METAIESKQSPLPLAQRPRQVHTITDRFSMANTYLINDERMIIVDPGSVLNVRLAVNYLQHFLHRRPSEIDLIVLTHLHPDHTAGVEQLRQICHAPVAASSVARHLVQAWRGSGIESMRQEGKGPSAGMANLIEQALAQRPLPGTLHHLDLFSPHYERQVQMVDLWLEDVGGLPQHPDWRVIASPGHTPESLCLYNPFSYELLCGDTAVTLDGGAILVRGGTNRPQLEETLNTLRALKVYYLYPGHGRPILGRRALAKIQVEW